MTARTGDERDPYGVILLVLSGRIPWAVMAGQTPWVVKTTIFMM